MSCPGDIAYVDGGPGTISAARGRGYRAALRHHGIEANARVVPGGLSQEHGTAAAHALLAEGRLPTAIVAFNDDVAAGLTTRSSVRG